jgi:bifunctional UDP-N-acetylglucosamine pyrophosphorylase/glucosamine-1-phosphate N-acetyltransferase
LSHPLASVVILAAGLGTRMKSATPKVLHDVCGAPILRHVLDATGTVPSARTIVVLGHGHESVRPILGPGVEVALQESQRGTGDALLSAAAAVGETAADGVMGDAILVVPGDTPLVTGEVLLGLVEAHVASGADATILTMILPDPTGYGRVLRDPDGLVARIVEHRDASPAELAVAEVNSGMFVLPAGRAFEILRCLGTDNAQGELYLTDVVAGLRAQGARVGAHVTDDPSVTLGVNSRVELAEVSGLMRARILRRWMLAGVTVDDPGSTHVEVGVTLEADTRLLPGTCLRGATSIATGSVIGPHSTLIDTVVGRDCVVRHSYTQGATLAAGAMVGPVSYLRPEARLMEGAKAGAFVEVKKSVIGAGSKVPHLSYIGDTTIGVGTNVGAGNITANYDGRQKHRTVIGDGVKTGSDTVFVAPVVVGDGATIGAGSIITKDVPPGALGIARAQQRNITGYDRRHVAAPAGAAPGGADTDGD